MRVSDKSTDPNVQSSPDEQASTDTGVAAGESGGSADGVDGGSQGDSGSLFGALDSLSNLLGHALLGRLPGETTLKRGRVEYEKTLYQKEFTDGSPESGNGTRVNVQGGRLSTSADGRVATDLKNGRFIAEGQVGAKATLASGQYDARFKQGALEGGSRGSVEVGTVSYSASGRVTGDLKNGQLVAESGFEAKAALVSGQFESDVKYGDLVEGKAHGSLFYGQRVSAQQRTVVDLKSATARTDFGAEAFQGIEVKGGYRGRVGIVETEARLEAFAGAKVGTTGNVVFDPKNGEIGGTMSSSAFVGGRVTAQKTVTVGGVGVTGGVHAYYGAGVQSDVTAKVKNGKLDLQWDVGAAVGAGWGYRIGTTIDPPKMMSTIGKYVPGAKEAFAAAGAFKFLAPLVMAAASAATDKAGGPGGAGAGGAPPPSGAAALFQDALKGWEGGSEDVKRYRWQGSKKID
jgi:hypothetical protein